MATLAETWFEVERRNIMFKPTTTLPDGSSLGYNGDPNNVISGNTSGETLLYNSPIATMYSQENGTLWFKESLPNIWVNLTDDSNSNDVSKIKEFIGNIDNSDPASTEFTEDNAIITGDSLEKAIDDLDIEIGDLRNFIGKENSVNDMPNFTERAVEVDGGTYTPNYIVDEEDLELGIAKLDNNLKKVSDVAENGVSWQEAIQAATVDDPTTVSTSFSDDEGIIWGGVDWSIGDKVVSLNTSVLGQIFEWSGSAWIYSNSLSANEAVSVRYDLPDSPGSQEEDGAAYMMNKAEDTLIKIVDFDLVSAASIPISSGYTPGSGDVSSSDTVETAIQKLDGNNDSQDTTLGITQGDTNLGTMTENNIITANGDVKTSLDELDIESGDVINFIGKDDTVNDMPNFTERSTEVGGGYIPDYIVDEEDLELSVAKLDKGLQDISATTSSIADETLTNIAAGASAVVNTYPVAGNIGAKFLTFVWDGSENRYGAEIYAMNNSTSVDSTEYGILTLGTGTDIIFTIAVNAGNVELTADNSAGATAVDVKIQRNLINT